MINYLDLKAINALYDAELREAVGRVLDSSWYLKGEATRQFERDYAEYIGTRHCIGCGNGLDDAHPPRLYRAGCDARRR